MRRFLRVSRLRGRVSAIETRPQHYRGHHNEVAAVSCIQTSPKRNRNSVEYSWNARRTFATGANKSSASDKPRNKANDSIDTFSNIIRGHDVELDFNQKIAGMAHSTVIGRSGKTVALTTVVVAPRNTKDPNKDRKAIGGGNSGRVCNYRMLARALEQKCRLENSSEMVPLTVDYRERHHAVGKIPTNANRTDNRRASDSEILASRAIDRSLRPLLRKETDSSSSGGYNEMPSIHLSCSIQAYPIKEKTEEFVTAGGHPISLALNSASLALKDRFVAPVAAVVLCLMEDGSILVNPSISTIQCHQQISSKQSENNKIVGELLYAGTKDSVVMMEFSGILSESRLLHLIRLAHESIQPVLDMQERITKFQESENCQDDNELRKQLGIAIETDDSNLTTPGSSQQAEESECQMKANRIYDEANQFVNRNLRDAVMRLFGAKLEDAEEVHYPVEGAEVKIHSEENDGPLLGKTIRGRKENIIKFEIKRLLRRFEPSDSQLAKEYRTLMEQDVSLNTKLGDAFHSQMLREAMVDASITQSSRADGRGGNNAAGSHTIRPLSMDVPALPDVVHGSAIFTRGETQVLCTTTLGPPKDGILQNNPFEAIRETLSNATDADTPSKTLPVGSLRYLRSQEHLESDLNSRRVLADREQTGDSGTLKERRRAFLQYDFPAYCNGEIQTGPSSASRREIGHGALAEKAILPILPSANQFPYAIRMTSEVTSSNGSSSMASVCGVVLSLLDAGVPVLAPVAGVSVGLVQDSTNTTHKLLLDISGTEDHYGLMDFKVAGTAEEVTAMQLDVKQPISLPIVTDALNLAKEGRNVILEEMKAQSHRSSDGAISNLSPRPELKPAAPRSSVVKFDPARKKDLLGPGGVVIRQMEDRFNVSLDLTQEGQCLLFGDDNGMVRKAKAAVMDLVSDVEVGETYEGTIIEIRDFGVIIELLRNKEGLCHVSELAGKEEIRSHRGGTKGLVMDRFRIGQQVDVVCTAVDPVQGTIRLRPASKKEAF